MGKPGRLVLYTGLMDAPTLSLPGSQAGWFVSFFLSFPFPSFAFYSVAQTHDNPPLRTSFKGTTHSLGLCLSLQTQGWVAGFLGSPAFFWTESRSKLANT